MRSTRAHFSVSIPADTDTSPSTFSVRHLTSGALARQAAQSCTSETSPLALSDRQDTVLERGTYSDAVWMASLMPVSLYAKSPMPPMGAAFVATLQLCAMALSCCRDE